MNCAQALHNFYKSFGLSAYDENSVPTGENSPAFPYLTYEFQESSFGDNASLTFSIWYHSDSWQEITIKANEIKNSLSGGGKIIPYDDGVMWVKKGSPFVIRMGEQNNDMIKRNVFNVTVEYLGKD